jgi:hypothetical protein
MPLAMAAARWPALAIRSKASCFSAGSGFRIDVPSAHPTLVAALLARGFGLNRVVPVMALRAEQLPERNGKLFAIAAQAYG